jgi:hypothetical protein
MNMQKVQVNEQFEQEQYVLMDDSNSARPRFTFNSSGRKSIPLSVTSLRNTIRRNVMV